MSTRYIDLLGYRLSLRSTKRRKDAIDQPLLPTLSELKSVKNGSKVSRLFRHIFEHQKINKILGVNLALISALAVVVPTNASVPQTPEAEQAIIQNVIVLTTQKGIQYPVENIKVSQGYRFYHPGVDYDGLTGDPIKPIMTGTVTGVDYSKYAYGNAVIVDHGNGITSLYAHLSKIFVKIGDFVDISSVIGLMGATGRASGDHLHLEIRDHNVPLNPQSILH